MDNEMKINRELIRQLIKEELENFVEQSDPFGDDGPGTVGPDGNPLKRKDPFSRNTRTVTAPMSPEMKKSIEDEKAARKNKKTKDPFGGSKKTPEKDIFSGNIETVAPDRSKDKTTAIGGEQGLKQMQGSMQRVEKMLTALVKSMMKK